MMPLHLCSECHFSLSRNFSPLVLLTALGNISADEEIKDLQMISKIVKLRTLAVSHCIDKFVGKNCLDLV